MVFHLHVHVIPRKDGIAMKPPASVKEAPDVLAEQARKLAAALHGPDLRKPALEPDRLDEPLDQHT